VGTKGAPTARNCISKAWSIVMGLAFGARLLSNVRDAYRYLMNVYEEGDSIFLFGFSRGAYTVRALGGCVPYVRATASRQRRTNPLHHRDVREENVKLLE